MRERGTDSGDEEALATLHSEAPPSNGGSARFHRAGSSVLPDYLMTSSRVWQALPFGVTRSSGKSLEASENF